MMAVHGKSPRMPFGYYTGAWRINHKSPGYAPPASASAILSFINLFSYLDRYVVSGAAREPEALRARPVGRESGIADVRRSWWCTPLTAPIFGALGDRRSRPRLIALGVACWSFATALSGFAGSYLALFAARASVGVGEAAYVTIAPSLLSDYFPARQRGRVMAIFFCAIPVGSALGYVVGGLVDKHFGWRAAFFVAGIPGLVLAALCLLLRDPPRGAQDRRRRTSEPRGAARRPWPASPQTTWADLWAAAAQTGRTCSRCWAYAAYTFALGGLAFWMPAFLERVRGIPRSEATVSFGTIVVVTGFVGTFVGGWLGDYCARYSRQAYLWLSAVATLVAAPFVWLALTTPSHTVTSSGWWRRSCACSCRPARSTPPSSIWSRATERATAIALERLRHSSARRRALALLIGALSDASRCEQAVKIVPVAVLVGGLRVGPGARHAAAVDTPPTPRRLAHALRAPRAIVCRCGAPRSARAAIVLDDRADTLRCQFGYS